MSGTEGMKMEQQKDVTKSQSSDEFNESEFLDGQRDCAEGVEHNINQSVSYDHGYATQYQHEQNLTGGGECPTLV